MTTAHPNSNPRTLAVVDAENLLGADRFHPYREAAGLHAHLAQIAELDDEDHIIVGSDVTIGHAIGLAFPGRRLVVGRGPDGADHALLDAAGSIDFLSNRFARVVIASGDHAFALLARGLRCAGVDVWVVARPDSLSRVLASEASSVRFLGASSPLRAA